MNSADKDSALLSCQADGQATTNATIESFFWGFLAGSLTAVIVTSVVQHK